MLDSELGPDPSQNRRVRWPGAILIFALLAFAAICAHPAQAMPIPLCPQSSAASCPVPPSVLHRFGLASANSQDTHKDGSVRNGSGSIASMDIAADASMRRTFLLALRVLMDPGWAGQILLNQYVRPPKLASLP
jgi:hypothetical protein